MSVTTRIALKLLGVFAVIVLYGALNVGNGSAQVAGGKHDLSYFGGSNFKFATDEVCVFCHTPHGANSDQTYTTDPTSIGGGSGLNGQFLWNRSIPNVAWTPYGSDTMDHTVTGPGPLSLLCLSCHDGVGAMNVLLNYPVGGQPAPWIGVSMNQFGDASPSDPNLGPLNIGGATCDGGFGTSCTVDVNGLQNDHPIGFTYGGSAVDPGLKDVGSMPLEIQARMAITGNRMECSTCHDPHRTNAPGDKNMFLVMTDNSGSQLCFGCHAK